MKNNNNNNNKNNNIIIAFLPAESPANIRREKSIFKLYFSIFSNKNKVAE